MARAAGNMLATYLAFCLAVRSLCAVRRVSVVSWWRTTKRNDSVGGLPESRHLDGIGADIVPDDDEDPDDVEKTARALGLQVHRSARSFHIELDP